VRVVLGNEACDADSAISAIALACVRRREGGVWIPVVSCVREVFPLRRDAVLVLEGVGVRVEDLVFLDEAPWEEVERQADAGVVLVDHNRLASALRSKYPWMEEKVVGIVDHHEDHGAYEWVRGAERVVGWDARAGRGVGSTCTLVAEEALRGGAEVGEDLARALVSVILVDTVNLDADRATRQDEAAVEALGARAGLGERAAQTAEFLRLSDAKHDPGFWASLSLRQKLEFDAKRFTMGRGAGGHMLKIASSSVLQPVRLLMACTADGGDGGVGGGGVSVCSAECAGELRRRAQTLGSDVVQIGSMLVEKGRGADGMRRELVVFVPADALGGRGKWLFEELVRDCTEGRCSAALGLKLRAQAPLAEDGEEAFGWLAVFDQENVAASRKQVIPAIGRWWEGTASSAE
jgi:inorganic pyrophosphatase/exopolyphosphatase